ncbi:MAG: CoA-binding protein [Flavobacteriia bacterium]|jgi:predicted CoA-binding protein
MKTTLVIGASTSPNRYSNIATLRLRQYKHEVILFGQRAGEIDGIPIETEWDPDWKVDTVTLYLGPQNQSPYYDKIIALKPKRIIFNPGTENSEFMELLRANGIETEIACTLVLLSLGDY